MTYSGNLTKLIPITVLLIILCMPISAQGQVTDVTSSFDYSGSIKSGDVKVYHFPGNDLYLELKVTTDSAADFYIFTESGYDEYCDETEAYFHPEETAEKKTSFSWSEKLTRGYYLVIDNDYISESGAIPTGTVSYDIDVGLDAVRPLNPLQENCFLIIVIICAVLGAGIIWYLRTPKNVELPLSPTAVKIKCPTCGFESETVPCPVCQPGKKV